MTMGDVKAVALLESVPDQSIALFWCDGKLGEKSTNLLLKWAMQ